MRLSQHFSFLLQKIGLRVNFFFLPSISIGQVGKFTLLFGRSLFISQTWIISPKSCVVATMATLSLSRSLSQFQAQKLLFSSSHPSKLPKSSRVIAWSQISAAIFAVEDMEINTASKLLHFTSPRLFSHVCRQIKGLEDLTTSCVWQRNPYGSRDRHRTFLAMYGT